MVIKDFLDNPYYAAILILVIQFLMLYLRTINIIHTTKGNIFGAIWSNAGVGLTWLLSMTIGANSILHGEPLPIVGFLVGGAVGTYLGMRREKKLKKDSKDL